MSDKDLKGRNEVGHGDALVLLPLVHGLGIVDEDDEVLIGVGTLVVDLGLSSLALNHFDGWWWW